VSDDGLPAELIELQRRRDHAFAAIEAHARVPRPDPGTDPPGARAWAEEWARLWADARDALDALHAHPDLQGPHRAERITRLRAAVRAS
jgi:hypothetical protein